MCDVITAVLTIESAAAAIRGQQPGLQAAAPAGSASEATVLITAVNDHSSAFSLST
jgi:hypothetical protein